MLLSCAVRITANQHEERCYTVLFQTQGETVPRMTVTVTHHLSQEDALKRVQDLLQNLKSDLGDKITGLRESWSGNACEFSFNAAGLRISGTLNVTSDHARVEGKLPFAAGLFKSKIESTIRDRAEKLLA